MFIPPVKFSTIDDPDEALIELKKDIGRARHLTNNAKRPDVVEYMVSISPHSLQYAHGFQNEKICIIACSIDGTAYIHVDKHLRTYNVRFAAARKCGDMLIEMDEHEQEEDIVLAGIMQHNDNGGCVDAIRYVYDSKLTETLLIKYAPKDYKYISRIHDKSKLTDNALWAFIKSNTHSAKELRFRELLTFEMCIYLAKKDGMLLNILPISNFTIDQRQQIIEAAVENCGYASQFIINNKELIEELDLTKIAWKSIKSRSDSIRYFPIEIRTFEMYAESVSDQHNNLQYVHRKDWFVQIAQLFKIEIS